MNEAVAAGETPLLGEAALQEAFAEFGRTHNGPSANHTATDAGETRLAAVEWKSGNNMRIIDIVAPFGGEAEMREQLSDSRT
jgi:RTX toxin acyltransferase family